MVLKSGSTTNSREIELVSQQLQALDVEVSRSAENMHSQGIYTSISDRELAAIAKKQELRAKLVELRKGE